MVILIMIEPGPPLAIGRAGDCLGPLALRRRLHNCNIPYTTVKTSSKFKPHCSLDIVEFVTHLKLNQFKLQF